MILVQAVLSQEIWIFWRAESKRAHSGIAHGHLAVVLLGGVMGDKVAVHTLNGEVVLQRQRVPRRIFGTLRNNVRCQVRPD